MITKLLTKEELKEMFIETLLNTTDAVTKVSAGSVLNGIAFGVATTAQRALKDIANVESSLFPESASGALLDSIAQSRGVAARFGASGSSCYVRVFADPLTFYEAGVNTFTSKSGIIFDLEEDITIGDDGFAYAKVRSQTQGENTNVDPTSITRVSPIPGGHNHVTNEYKATGGRDIETDELFRQRIMYSVNALSRGTLAMLEQVFMSINNDVLRVYYSGVDNVGKTVLTVLSQNGIDFTDNEFDEIITKANHYFSLSELKPYGYAGNSNVVLRNPDWYPIDVSIRLDILSNFNVSDVRREMQVQMNKYIDYRFYNKNRIEWDDLLEIAKNTPGVSYVYDNFFDPQNDLIFDTNQLPRIRGFLLLDSEGSLYGGGSNANDLNPIYYPNVADFSYQRSLFSTL